MVGTTISHYKVLEKIGQGGMGEVYLAQDTTLDRKVALKFLHEELEQDTTARKRFLREAKSAAALDHPYICHIHEVGEVEGKSFISMEYIQGATLQEKLAQGPLPLKDALERAVEVAEALEEAHNRGIVHRDLKPSNIMLTPQGHVKVMDFGLAKQVTPVEGEEQEITTALTRHGATLGTVPYMSPEQVRGQEVDTRSDIFSFGVVLYEMLSGVNPFKKGSTMDTATAILTETVPPLTRYTENIPVLLQHTVKKMLAKEPDRRYQLIHEVRTDLGELIEESGDSILEVATEPSRATSAGEWWRRALPWSIALAMAVTAGVAFWAVRTPSPQVVKRLVINPEANMSLVNDPRGDLAISPDGKRIVYRADNEEGIRQLYQRSIGELEATPIAATRGLVGSIFFSPDGESVAFTSNGKLTKVALTGGPPIAVCDVFSGAGVNGSWSREGTIVFSPDDFGSDVGSRVGLYSVSAAGGEPEILAEPDPDKGENWYRYPQFLPGDGAVIFTIGHESGFRIAVLTLESREQKILIEGGQDAHYSPTGHLLYESPGTNTVMAVPFDLARLEVTGNPVAIVEGIRGHSFSLARLDYAFSTDGTLVYIPAGQSGEQNLFWVDRKGMETLVTEERRAYAAPRISPDGQRFTVGVRVGGESNIWTYDLERDSFSRLTFKGERNGTSQWSPDSQWIIFVSSREGPQNLYRKRADGSGSTERLTTNDNLQMASSWSADGSVLAFHEGRANWILPLDGDREPRRLDLDGSFPEFSPDGKWLAYSALERGQRGVYVSPYAEPEVRWSVSGAGVGLHPTWSPDGTEIFYVSGDRIMIVPVETEPTFSAGRPSVLFEGSYVVSTITRAYRYYDVSPDGQRFLMLKEAGTEEAQINVVLNWFEELKERVPVP